MQIMNRYVVVMQQDNKQTHTSYDPLIYFGSMDKNKIPPWENKDETNTKQTAVTKQSSGEHTGHQAGVPQERLATPSCQGDVLPDTSSQMFVEEFVQSFAITRLQL